MNNVEVFQQTRQIIASSSHLTALTEKAVRRTGIYGEGFVSRKHPKHKVSRICFEENLTLIPAFRCAASGKKTAVLNFANPVEPGGGVLRGANAQEEYLCRASNLYFCLTGENAAEYYLRNRTILGKNQYNSMFLATDEVVYSPGVTFIRQDAGYCPGQDCHPWQAYTEDWQQIDVLTCAAPFFRNGDYMIPNGDLEELLVRRIQNVLEAAIDNGVECLILGAFGCGAFHNPPAVVAAAFRRLFLSERYCRAFREVVFAVKRSGAHCENIRAFRQAFPGF